MDDKKLTDSGKINITSDNPTVEIDYVIQNPTIQPVADGTVQADFHTLSIDLDAAGPHTVSEENIENVARICESFDGAVEHIDVLGFHHP